MNNLFQELEWDGLVSPARSITSDGEQEVESAEEPVTAENIEANKRLKIMVEKLPASVVQPLLLKRKQVRMAFYQFGQVDPSFFVCT